MRYFNLFSDILITKGVNRILISDLQRNYSELQSLELNNIIEELKSNSIEDVFALYDQESKEMLQEYLNFLVEKEYGFITENSWDENFPPLQTDFSDSSTISNIFIETADLMFSPQLVQSIENLGIRHLVIYCESKLSLMDFLTLEDTFNDSCLESIEIFSLYHEDVNDDFVKKLDEKCLRIYSLIFHKCDNAAFEVTDTFKFNLVFTDQHLKINSCGKVDLKYFETNMLKVLEAINHNSCLHKKIGIDINGNIKNCPAMCNSFGNINTTTLEEAILHEDFKKYWNLTKSGIQICKDCEFRNICTDCRAFTEQTHKNNDGLDISKPLKCGYNPYTSQWEEWSLNPLKQKAIQSYSMQQLNYDA
ncbi:SPASM domain peptide maturase, grasp-with-spasm system [Pedobacter suwonensis]|uniref:SPASM domain peptide maturase, grasp-with-spasm system n=1 Tax=Pedobacter suwonensis TaxID=332999 RepID=A0A1I0T8F5_9SPHI|nr:grasp-with-spasm system SPASM domain peptide maturase [Pedobacter suwonensis]SFA47306.1 SPASM domain peptide maturase, grasp-with-spasm system [Pedobacter suwonensis]